MRPIDPNKVSKKIVEFIQKTFQISGFSQAVIALSGGIDSAVSCALTVRALGKENIFPLLMPYGKLNPRGTDDALEVAEFLGIPKENIMQIDIKSIVDQILKIDPQISQIRKGNIMSRTRMILVFDNAKKRRALVIGTENKSEHLLGYFTRFGDEASDIEPIRNLYKTQVYQLAEFLKLPNSVITKHPTAGLWENQTDEGEFGFSYKDADQVLYWYFDKKLSVSKICEKNLVKNVVDKIIQFANTNSFKHNAPFISKK